MNGASTSRTALRVVRLGTSLVIVGAFATSCSSGGTSAVSATSSTSSGPPCADGTGSMRSFLESKAPQYPLGKKIAVVVVSPSIAGIGAIAATAGQGIEGILTAGVDDASKPTTALALSGTTADLTGWSAPKPEALTALRVFIDRAQACASA